MKSVRQLRDAYQTRIAKTRVLNTDLYHRSSSILNNFCQTLYIHRFHYQIYFAYHLRDQQPHELFIVE